MKLFLFALSLGLGLCASADEIYPLRNLDSVYLAGPLFNDSERREMEEIAHVLESEGFKTFLPHRDGFLLDLLQPYLVKHFNLTPEKASLLAVQAVDALDVYQIVQVNGSMVVNLNGRVPDEGSIAEVGMAWMLGKPAIAYRDDFRSLTRGMINPLISGRTDFIEVSQKSKIVSALRRRIEEMKPRKEWAYIPPPSVQARVREGELLWEMLSEVRRGKLDRHEEIAAIAGLIIARENSCEAKVF